MCCSPSCTCAHTALPQHTLQSIGCLGGYQPRFPSNLVTWMYRCYLICRWQVRYRQASRSWSMLWFWNTTFCDIYYPTWLCTQSPAWAESLFSETLAVTTELSSCCFSLLLALHFPPLSSIPTLNFQWEFWVLSTSVPHTLRRKVRLLA